jgi:hypothetical protein
VPRPIVDTLRLAHLLHQLHLLQLLHLRQLLLLHLLHFLLSLTLLLRKYPCSLCFIFCSPQFLLLLLFLQDEKLRENAAERPSSHALIDVA